MKLNIEIDLANDPRDQISLVANLLNNLTNAARRPSTNAQPAVAENTGSDGMGLTLSPGAIAVAGAAVTGAEPEPNAAPAVVKERKPRAKKEEAAVQAGEQISGPTAHTTDGAQTASAPVESTALTLDEVRPALQAFTAAKGMDAGIQLLKDFGAARISELKAEDFAAFVKKCAV